jgi:hypothetical protein
VSGVPTPDEAKRLVSTWSVIGALLMGALTSFLIALHFCTATGCSASQQQAEANAIAKALPYEKVACALVANSVDPAVVGPLCTFVADEAPQLEALLRGKKAALGMAEMDGAAK